MPHAVEKARVEDTDAILKIEKICFPEDAWSSDIFREELSGGLIRRSTVVRDGSGKTVAYCISRCMMGEMQIFKLAVHPLHRRKGLAKALLRDALEHLGRGKATLEVAAGNVAAISLYYETGFRKIGVREKYYRKSGRDALVMERSI